MKSISITFYATLPAGAVKPLLAAPKRLTDVLFRALRKVCGDAGFSLSTPRFHEAATDIKGDALPTDPEDRLKRISELLPDCKVIWQGYPRGMSCLAVEQWVETHPKGYTKAYKASLSLCTTCQIRKILSEKIA